MRTKVKLSLFVGGAALVCVAGYLLNKVRMAQAVPVFRLVVTNSPAIPIPEQYQRLMPTNNWVTEVPFDQDAETSVSVADIEAIQKLGMSSRWWPQRIEKIVFNSPDLAWIEYPTNSATTLRRLTVTKELGKWRIKGQREWKRSTL